MDFIVAQKLPMLKQGIKSIKMNLFEHMHYPNFLSSSSNLMQSCSWGFFSP